MAAQQTIPLTKEAASQTVNAEKFYRVGKDAQVPRGASSYLLRAGKVISNRGYDIAELKKLGVPLEEADVKAGVNPNPPRANVAA